MKIITAKPDIAQTLYHLKEEVSDEASRFIEASMATSTRRAYKSDWQIFKAWCNVNNKQALPASPETLAAFISQQALQGIAPSTLTRRLAAIRCVHDAAGLLNPTSHKIVTSVMRGIRRTVKRGTKQKTPLIAEMITKIIAAIPTNNLRGLRDRALISIGFAGAFRRSELVALTADNIHSVPEGLKISIQASKTDQEGHGYFVPIFDGRQISAVANLAIWLDAAEIRSGSIFRSIGKGGKIKTTALSSNSVAIIIKSRAAAAGIDPEKISGHSLRSGFLTSAAKNKASIWKMMDVSRHKSVQTIRGYVRNSELFEDHAGASFL